MFVITQEGRAAQAAAKAAYMARGAAPVHGVPSAAGGVAGHAGEAAGDAPGPLMMPGMSGMSGWRIAVMCAEDFRRPYMAEGHAAQSPANPPGLPCQSAPVAHLALTAAGRRP